jgi:hypothetical protein
MENSELSQWLRDNSFGDYCKVFWDAGLRDLKSVTSLTETQLKEAGVKNKKTAHKLWKKFHEIGSGHCSMYVAL